VSPMLTKQDSQANGTAISAEAAQEWARQAGLYLRARQLAAQAQLAPLAAQARIAAQQGLVGARTWGAPQLDRMGVALQERMAPQVAAALAAAARRIEPIPPLPPPRRRWPVFVAGAVVIAGGAAAAVIIMNRRNANGITEPGEPDETASASDVAREMDAVSADVNGQSQTP
jgi:hypothetical protein